MIKLYNTSWEDFVKSQDFIDLAGGAKQMIIVTDPPFNVGYHYNQYKDNMNDNDYYEWLESLFEMLPFVCIHYPEQLYKISFQMGQFPEKIISWVYNSMTPKQHRDIAFFGVKPDLNKVKQPYKNPTDKRIKERIANGSTGTRLYDWWYIQQVKNVSKNKTKNTHPCVMPLEVMKRIIGILPNNIIVFDPFMGSGTTGLACKELGVDFVGCEINEEYYNIAQERIFNGK